MDGWKKNGPDLSGLFLFYKDYTINSETIKIDKQQEDKLHIINLKSKINAM